MSHRFWFYLTLVLLPSQLALHLWPQWAHLLGRRIDYLSPTIYLTDITVFLTLIFWACTFCHPKRERRISNKLRYSSLRYAPGFRMTWYKSLALIVGIFIILNTFFSLSPPVTLLNWLRWLLLGLWGWYIVKTKPNRQHLILALAVSVIWSSVIALLQWERQQALGGIFWLLGERWYTTFTPGLARANWCMWGSACREVIRSYATFPHPNVLAGYLVTLWPLFCLNFRSHKIIKLALILIPFALFTTFSRLSWVLWLVLCVGLILYSFFMRKLTRSILVLALAIIAGIIITFPYLNSLTRGSESIVIRQTLAATAWTLWRQTPLLGTGLGASLVGVAQLIPKTGVYVLQPAHSLPLLLLTELGLIGIFILVIIIRRIIPTFSFKSPFFLCLVTYLLLSLFDHYHLSLEQGRLFLVLLFAYSTMTA